MREMRIELRLEFVFELAWSLMKDYFLYQGNPAITGYRDAIRSAFKQQLIIDGEGWMEMIESRMKEAASDSMKRQ